MPPPPIQSPTSADQILRSLEEIRESLARRVEELSLAVDQLRAQAGLLERPSGTSDEESTMPLPRPRSSSTPSTARPDAPQNAIEHHTRGSTNLFPSLSRPYHRTPSPTSERPLSNEEIHLLLDRASQPAVNPPNDLPVGRFEETLERLRTTRQRIREMQTRTSALGDIMDHDIAPRFDPLSADIGDLPWGWTDPLQRALRPEAPQGDRPRRHHPPPRHTGVPTGVDVYDNADEALAAANDYLTSMRSDPLRVPTRRELDRMGAGMDAIEPELIEAAIRERFISQSSSTRGRAISRGCRPTNVQRLRHAPKPEVVRSTPPSPSSTITPDLPVMTFPAGPSRGAAAVAAATPTHRRLESIRARRSSTAGDNASPMTFGNSSLALPIPTAPRMQRRRGDDEALTFRGMDVNARINDPDAPRTSGELDDSLVTEFILSVFTQLRDDNIPPPPLDDTPIVQPLPPFAPRLANTRIPTPASRRPVTDLAAAEERLATARRRLVQLEAQAEQEEADRRERRGVLGVEDVLRGLGEGDAAGAGAIGGSRHRDRSAALTAGGEGSGPRNERPEDVDTVVQIRQFQEGRDETRQRVRERLRHLADVRRAADDVYQARRGTAATAGNAPERRSGHDLAYWANDAGDDETIFDATRRALAGGARAAPRPTPATIPVGAGTDGVYVTVAISTDPIRNDAGDDVGGDNEIVESMRRQFESLTGGSDPSADGAAWHMQVIGPNGQVLEAHGEGAGPGNVRGGVGGGMEGSMERLALAIVQSADGVRDGQSSGVLEGNGEGLIGIRRLGMFGSRGMSREDSGSSNRAVEGEVKDDHRGSVGISSDVKDPTPLQAQNWPIPEESSRRARPYISMLDL